MCINLCDSDSLNNWNGANNYGAVAINAKINDNSYSAANSGKFTGPYFTGTCTPVLDCGTICSSTTYGADQGQPRHELAQHKVTVQVAVGIAFQSQAHVQSFALALGNAHDAHAFAIPKPLSSRE